MHPAVSKILIKHEEIIEKIKELGNWVNQNYCNEDDLLLVVILKGAFPFAAELIKYITIDHSMDFMIVSSYQGTKTTGEVKIVLDLNTGINGRKVLIVEDLIETGRTIANLKKLLKTRNPKEVKIMTLISKPDSHNKMHEPDKTGFILSKEYIVGFGFDYNNKFRNLPYIGVFNKNYKK